MQKSSKHEAQCIKWHKKTVPSRTQSLSYDRGEKEKQKGGGNREGGSGRQRKKAGKKEKPGRGIRKNILTSAVWLVLLFFFHPATTYCKRTFFVVGLSSVTTDISRALEKGSVTSSLVTHTHRQSHPGPCRGPPRARQRAGTPQPGPGRQQRGRERPRLGCQKRHLPRSQRRRARGQGRFLWGSLRCSPLKRFLLNRGGSFSRFVASPPDQRIEFLPNLNSRERTGVSLVSKASRNCDV